MPDPFTTLDHLQLIERDGDLHLADAPRKRPLYEDLKKRGLIKPDFSKENGRHWYLTTAGAAELLRLKDLEAREFPSCPLPC